MEGPIVQTGVCESMSVAIKKDPEFQSIPAFVEFVKGDERQEYTLQELHSLCFALKSSTASVRGLLKVQGLKLEEREPIKHTRGFTTSSSDRWYGPGSCNSHGGSGFSDH